jgi:hypothetical protein
MFHHWRLIREAQTDGTHTHTHTQPATRIWRTACITHVLTGQYQLVSLRYTDNMLHTHILLYRRVCLSFPTNCVLWIRNGEIVRLSIVSSPVAIKGFLWMLVLINLSYKLTSLEKFHFSPCMSNKTSTLHKLHDEKSYLKNIQSFSCSRNSRDIIQTSTTVFAKPVTQ